MITGPEPNLAAIVAAAQASDATAELLRYAREGAYGQRSAFGETEPTPNLAQALKLAIEIELAEDGILDEEERASLGQLAAACARFIDGWMG